MTKKKENTLSKICEISNFRSKSILVALSVGKKTISFCIWKMSLFNKISRLKADIHTTRKLKIRCIDTEEWRKFNRTFFLSTDMISSSQLEWKSDVNMQRLFLHEFNTVWSVEYQQNEKNFSIKWRLALIWPKTPYICKTHTDHAHLHNAQKLT